MSSLLQFSHRLPTPSYSHLWAAWDSNNLYIAWQLVDITDVIELKLAALDCLVSQGYAGAYARKRIEASDGAFGTQAHVAYAEPFIALRSVTHYYLPVPEQMLLAAESSDHETMARYSYRLPVD